MPKAKFDRLTDRACRVAKPQDKPVALYDGRGLYLQVLPTGRKVWRVTVQCRRGNQRLLRTVTLGEYPTVSLADARLLRDRVLEEYKYPLASSLHKSTKTTVAELAERWLASREKVLDPDYTRTIRLRLQRYILPALGHYTLDALTAPVVFDFLVTIAERSPETAKRVRGIVSQMLRYGVASGVAMRDVTADIRGQLPAAKKQHYPAPTQPEEVAKYLRMLWSYFGVWKPVEVAVRLLPYLFVRSGELRSMRWDDIDVQAREWRFVASKTGTPHIVPLSRQALELILSLPRLSQYVFPSFKDKKRPLSDGALLAAYRSLGITSSELVPHSWRAIARTLLEERLKYPYYIIELQLSHTVRDPLGRAYNRTEHLETRKEMMQAWADYLDTLRDNVFNKTGGSDE